MSKKLLVTALKNLENPKPDAKMLCAVEKIEKQEKLSSEEFLKVYDAIWKEGPKVKYTS